MHVDDIRHVLVIGAGTMGRQIAWQCATHGYEVTLYDVASEALEDAMEQIRRFADRFVAEERLSQDEVDAALARIDTTSDAEIAAAEADLLSESVPENPELKREVFAQFADLCPPRTIFTTNTSSFVPSMFADAIDRPAQFAALHFHQDVWDSNVVDVMPHSRTAEETIETLRTFGTRIGQIPIVLEKEQYGYVFNTMLNALNRAALTLAANGIASVEDIDRAWMGVMKMPIGPFGIIDKVGLDTALDITAYWANVLDDAQLHTNAAFLSTYVDEGRLGVKSGEGFYSYPDPAFADPAFLTVDEDV